MGGMSVQREAKAAGIAIGIGCDRSATSAEIRALVKSCLAAAAIDPHQVICLATVDFKLDEPGMIDLARQMELPIRGFSVLALEAETPRLATPSEVVYRAIGCHGVAEAAALAAIGPSGRLLLAKRRAAHVTCALAISSEMAGGLDKNIERKT